MADATPPAPSPPPAAPKAAPAAPPAIPTGDHAVLAAEFPGSTFAILEDGKGVLTVPADDLFAAASRTRSMGYSILSLLSAYDRVDHFGVLYAFVKPAATPEEFGELRLRVVCPKAAGEPRVPSLVDLTAAADWHEREMYDMYGITFVGHPDLRRIFLPEGWSGHPQRKDYKEPEQYVSLRDGEDTVTKHIEEGAW